MSKPIIIADCAINTPSINCFNQLVWNTKQSYAYHHPSAFGCETLENSPLPKALIIFGSASHVTENLKWQIDLASYAKKLIEQGVPTLGICFGHQLMAQAYGGEVDFVDHETKKKFSGLRKVKFENDFYRLKSGEEYSFVVSHAQEVKKIPDCFELVATSSDCRFDAIRHKTLPYIGTQFHPEASDHFIQTVLNQSPFGHDGKKFIDAFLSPLIRS